MLENYVQKIYELCTPFIPKESKRFVLRGVVNKTNYSFTYYVKVEESYIQCYKLEKMGLFTRDELRDMFSKLFDICLKAKEEGMGSYDGVPVHMNEWKEFVLSVEDTGAFSVDYSYDDPEIILSQEWKEKYLI